MMGRAVLFGALLLASTAVAQPILRHEPPMGRLMPGQRVLVDDGTCPPGQVKEAIGGDHRAAGGQGMLKRQYRCVRRPRGS